MPQSGPMPDLLKALGRALIVKAVLAVIGGGGGLYAVLTGDALSMRSAIGFGLIGAILALLIEEVIRAWRVWKSVPDYVAWGAHEHLSQKELSCLWADLHISDENFKEPTAQHRRAALDAYGKNDFFWNPGKWLPDDVDEPIDAQHLADVAAEICAKSGQNIPRIIEEIRSHRYEGITVEQLVPPELKDDPSA